MVVPVSFPLAHRTINLKIETPDSVQLGAWLILPEDPRIPDDVLSGPPADESVSASLRHKPTILLFHGNTAARAVPFRITHYLTYTSRFEANVLAIDYRGYGDSTGTPSELGVKVDARAAWDWLINKGVSPENILIVGHSLGTAVASLLAEELTSEGDEGSLFPAHLLTLLNPYA